MSLKAFHLVFVFIATLLAFGFGTWAVRHYRQAGDVAALCCGISSFFIAAALLVYGRWFLRKLKGVGYL